MKMPLAMGISPATTILSQYGEVATVRRLQYRSEPTVETGVQPFRLVEELPTKVFSRVIAVGIYHLSVRSHTPGQIRLLFRCNSVSIVVRECPRAVETDRNADSDPVIVM